MGNLAATHSELVIKKDAVPLNAYVADVRHASSRTSAKQPADMVQVTEVRYCI